MDKAVTTKPKRPNYPQEESPGEQSPQIDTPDALPSARLHRGGRPNVLVASTKGEASGRQKWLGLLEAEHSKSSPEALMDAAAFAPRDWRGRAEVKTGNEGDTPTPLSPHKNRRLTRYATTSPAAAIRRAPFSGVQSPWQSLRVGSSRIPTVGTPGGSQASQLFTPYESRPLSPELTGSPPRIKVVVASTAGSPKARPYDGFPGVPMYIGAPEVIVFTPRLLPSAAATPPRQDVVTGSAHQLTPAESSSPIER
ncbi:hypothetical protein MRX96_040153 [Rhipicephalus microplus]